MSNKSFKPEFIFYIVGVVFLLFTISYFAQNYLFMLSDAIKTVILVCITIASFFIADHLAGRNI